MSKQLEELVAAKQAHESALLGKCAELLNQKKAKIREQQRLLACTTSDRRRGEKSRDGGPSRVGVANVRGGAGGVEGRRKRKAEEAALRQGGGDDDGETGHVEDAFEGPSSARTINQEDEDKDEEMDDRVDTPQANEEDDVTEDEELDLHNGQEHPGKNETQGEGMQLDTAPSRAKDLPPDRDLPFGKATSRSAMPAQQSAANDDEETDDDDDDEL